MIMCRSKTTCLSVDSCFNELAFKRCQSKTTCLFVDSCFNELAFKPCQSKTTCLSVDSCFNELAFKPSLWSRKYNQHFTEIKDIAEHCLLGIEEQSH